MPDLIEKFFREDLTEAEEQALSEELAVSEDAAERFGTLAEAAYRRFQQPEPEWPGPGGPSLPKGGFKLWPILLVLGFGAGAAFWALTHGGGRSLEASISKKAPSIVKPLEKEVPAERKAVPDKAPVKKTMEEGQRTALLQPKGHVPAKGAAKVPEPRTILTPVNLDEDPTHKFSSISVKINQAQVGLVKVRVVDMGGFEITPLFEGNLQPGHWVFDWDGKLGNGAMVAPGYYQIEVRSGTFKGKKNIRIQ